METTIDHHLPHSTPHPYEDLYIYYIEGRLPPDTITFGSAFIGNWQEEDDSFLFFSCPSMHEVKKMLANQPHLTLIDKYHMTYDQWQGGAITPFKIGRFIIFPPWENYSRKMEIHTDTIPIALDPGVVFGSGMHTTTHDCIEALELLCYRENIQTAIDLGTGTGLLALAAGKLGCKQILAVDFNLLAARTAQKNVLLNRLYDSIIVVQGRAEKILGFPSDLLIANIHYDIMKQLINTDDFLSHKWFILSGLLRSQAKALVDQLAKRPVDILKTWKHDGIWFTFFGKIN